MLKVLGCVVHEHDLRLVAMSAVICVLGCYTTTVLLTRDGEGAFYRLNRWLVCAAVVFGFSVWSLHFVAMLAFLPGSEMAYDVGLTALSVVVATGGALAALIAWKAPMPRPVSIAVGGTLLGLAISGMHYVGVAAMTFSGFVVFDPTYVVASVAASIVFSVIALQRAANLKAAGRPIEVGVWLALAICGLHFTGMTAITMAPGTPQVVHGTVLGTTTLAIVVACVSGAILIASLAATLVEQHMSQRALQDLGRMRLLSNLAQETLFIHRDGVVLEINNAGERLFTAPAKDIVGRSVQGLFAEDSVPALCRREQCPPLGRPPEELQIKTRNGTYVTVELSCQPIEYLGKPATAVALRDLTNRKRDEARIRHLAHHDGLTNLPNRHAFQERLGMTIDAAAQKSSALALLYIDLDRFKPVNDLFGHAVGDALLIQVAKRILGELSSNEMLARIGGDEFVLLLTSQPLPEKVSIVGMRLVEALKRPFQIEGHRIEIGASVGIALYPDDGANADTLMRAADAAMYRVKDEGRGGLRFFEASMNAQLQARLQLEQELAGAAERGELMLHYQPMVNGVTGEVETYEALIRWNHPKRGLVPPMEFIPLAEETGLIDEIGRWVIDTACREAKNWPHPWRVSFNVSPKQFRQTDVCAAVAAALNANLLDPRRVVVEVTEGVLIDDADKAVAILNRLRDMGLRVALDDFGTGYSSLSYLQLFKFDKFKVDKSFVKRLGQSEDALTIIRTIVNLGHNLGLHVTAEGVETQVQLDILRSLGCDQFQGYLIARPAPVEAFTELDRFRALALFNRDRRSGLV